MATTPDRRWRDLPTLMRSALTASGVLEVVIDPGTTGSLMTSQLHADLARMWGRVADEDNVRCLLVRGGPDFCAGSDTGLIQGTAHAGADELARLLDESRRVILGALRCELPVVAAVRGRAVGAALGLALLADVCVVADDAKLIDGHARVGVPAGDHAVLVWPMHCGMAIAKRHLLLPEVVDGRRAHAVGLVSECVPDDQVDACARELAGRLARQAPLAVSWTKRALAHWYEQMLPTFESSLAHELLAYGSADAREGARSLADSRPARFTPVPSGVSQ